MEPLDEGVVKRGVGRPLGSTIGPKQLLINEMKATAKTMAKLRGAIESQINIILTQLKAKDTQIDDRMKAIKIISDAYSTLNSSLDSGAKLVLAETKAQPTSEKESGGSIEEVMANIFGGKQ